MRRAAKLARSFVKDDFTVVSGLAQGIDTVAHTAAIAAKGRTVAVLRCSVPRSPPVIRLRTKICGGRLPMNFW
jgi:DNA processing protein